MIEEWTVNLSESQKDFTMTHNPCGANYSGSAESSENANIMIDNNKSGHTCSV